MRIVLKVAASKDYIDNIIKESMLNHISAFIISKDTMYDISIISKSILLDTSRYSVNSHAIDASDVKAMVSLVVSRSLKAVAYERFRLVGISKNNSTLVFRVTEVP